MATEMTIAQKFAATAAILQGQEPEFEFTAADAAEFVLDRMEKATRKSRSTRQPKPEVLARRAAVLDALASVDEPMTQAAVAAMFDGSDEPMTSPQAGGALRALVAAGLVEAFDAETKRGAKTYAITDAGREQA